VAVIAHGIGGMQRHTHDLVRGLVAAGHDVEVICPGGDGLSPDLYGARWHLLAASGRTDARWPDELRGAFVTAEERRPFDVIQSESSAALPLMRIKTRPPVVVTYHGNYLGLAKAHLWRMTRRPATMLHEGKALADVTLLHLRHGNAWIFRDCVSIVPSRQQARDTARSHLVARGLVHVVPNGVDATAFAPGDRDASRADLGLPPGSIFVAVGRLARDKGFDVAVSAFARVAPSYPDAHLVIVGDGEQRDALSALATRLGVASHVLFVGAQPAAKVASYLAASDVFLFPTLREEAAPLVLPEAMACGLPVVASRKGGITEVLEGAAGEGDAGLLLSPGSVDELEGALRQLLDDPAARRDLADRALRRFRQEYTVERMIERTVDVYRVAIARAERQAA